MDGRRERRCQLNYMNTNEDAAWKEHEFMYRNVINVFYAVAGSLRKCDRTGMKTSDLILRISGTVFNELPRRHELREAPLHNHEQREPPTQRRAGNSGPCGATGSVHS